jgi:hypothetical protein
VKRLCKLLSSALVLLWSVTPAAALPLTLTLVPSSPTVATGQSFSVAVVVGGLTQVDGDFVQEIALESFDLSLQFDTSRLQLTSLTFASSLGDPNDSFETFTNGPGDANGTGVVTLGEFSFLTESQLLALQDAPFTLATLQLQAGQTAGGTLLQLVNLSGSSLGGVAGLPLGDELEAPSALLVTLVPEPATAALGLLALALLAHRSRTARA